MRWSPKNSLAHNNYFHRPYLITSILHQEFLFFVEHQSNGWSQIGDGHLIMIIHKKMEPKMATIHNNYFDKLHFITLWNIKIMGDVKKIAYIILIIHTKMEPKMVTTHNNYLDRLQVMLWNVKVGDLSFWMFYLTMIIHNTTNLYFTNYTWPNCDRGKKMS